MERRLLESKMAVKYCGFRISFDGGEVVWCLEVGEDVLFLVAGLTADQLFLFDTFDYSFYVTGELIYY
jgi:hypothetical protein